MRSAPARTCTRSGRPLRDAHRTGAVRRRVRGHDRAQARLGEPATAAGDQPQHSARARAGRPVGAQQEPRRPPRQRRPAHHRARAGQGAIVRRGAASDTARMAAVAALRPPGRGGGERSARCWHREPAPYPDQSSNGRRRLRYRAAPATASAPLVPWLDRLRWWCCWSPARRPPRTSSRRPKQVVVPRSPGEQLNIARTRCTTPVSRCAADRGPKPQAAGDRDRRGSRGRERRPTRDRP